MEYTHASSFRLALPGLHSVVPEVRYWGRPQNPYIYYILNTAVGKMGFFVRPLILAISINWPKLVLLFYLKKTDLFFVFLLFSFSLS